MARTNRNTLTRTLSPDDLDARTGGTQLLSSDGRNVIWGSAGTLLGAQGIWGSSGTFLGTHLRGAGDPADPLAARAGTDVGNP